MRFRRCNGERGDWAPLGHEAWRPLPDATERLADNGGNVLRITYEADRICLDSGEWTMTLTIPTGVRLCQREEVQDD